MAARSGVCSRLDFGLQGVEGNEGGGRGGGNVHGSLYAKK
jgi:hypothetical protein